MSISRRLKPATLVFLSHRRAFSAYVTKSDAYNNIELSPAQRFTDVLIDESVALAFVDGADDGWRRAILAAKTNAATRRVPICFVGDGSEARAEAVTCGADLALGWGELNRRFGNVIGDLARIPDTEALARLACECQEPLPELALRGVNAFNRGEFYRQHDLFEAQWVATTGPVRDLYRAILQVGVAYYQIERGNYRGALKMLQRSAQWLRILPDRCQGVDVERLRRDSFAVRAELQRLGPERLHELDRRLLTTVEWKPTQSAST